VHGVLLTGFVPFGDFSLNPSQQIAEALHGERIEGHRVESLVLPVEFGLDVESVLPAIEQIQPHLVLSLGLAARAPCLWVERIALNLRRVDGGEHPIIERGPAAYFARLEAESVASAIRAVDVPAVAHVYAGNYLCNHIMYRVLHHLSLEGDTRRAGFIHLPPSSALAIEMGCDQSPSLPLEQMEIGVRAAIASVLCSET
jgi:pyroglutamyl-peptidase